MPDNDSSNSKKKYAFEGMEFHETELRALSNKSPFLLAPEASNLDESNKAELFLRDDATAFLAGKLDPNEITPLCDGCHKVKA